MRKEIEKRIEEFLSTIKGIEFYRIATSQTRAGMSVYFRVAKMGQLNIIHGDGVKVRFSDHSTTNHGRVFGEVHYNIDGSNWTENRILYALGVEGYEYRPTQFKEEITEIPAEHMQEDYEIISSRTTKRGNVRHTIKRMVGTHYQVVKI